MTNVDDAVSLPKDRQPTLRLVPMPADTNHEGSVFGGWIMSQVDISGSIPAIKRARGRVATVAVESFEFHQPVCVGDLISCYADVMKVGRTSIAVKGEVFAERRAQPGQCIKVTEAILTYVALDENRRPRVVPPEGHGP